MLNNIQIEILKAELPFYSKLNNEDKSIIADNAVSKKLVRNYHLSNNECIGLVLVVKGQLRAFITSVEGKQITLYRLLDKDICIMSASCIIKDINFDIHIETEKDTEIIIIPSAIYNLLNNKDENVKSYTLQLVSSRFSDVMWVMDQLVFSSMGKRLANYLLEQSYLEDSTTLNITHEYIAKDLGSAREVITRLLKYFQSEGLVSISRKSITIKDRKKLNQVV